MEYQFTEIEDKWQRSWRASGVYKVTEDPSKPKYYVLDMFPYPSGAGLHVGHPLGYIGSDIFSRYKRLKGFNVLHPMGYDAFGLPAEQYAIQTGQHPAITTRNNIERYREQLDRMGFSFDWSREVCTCDPDYYKWTQWIFLQMFGSWYNRKSDKAEPIASLIEIFNESGNIDLEAVNDETQAFTGSEWNAFDEPQQQQILLNYRLAFLSEAMVNWCPALGTVLANEEVKDGVSERGGFPVERKLMKQWSLRISAYAERLLQGLDRIDWSESLKEAQRNWIGKSEGALVKFEIFSEMASPPAPLRERGETISQWKTSHADKWRSLKEHGRENRRRSTPAESLLWSRLRNRQTGFKFRRQHAIGPFIVDFVCFYNRLVVEVDGEIHNFQQEEDREREAFLLENKFSILRFTNDRVLNDTDNVIDEIIRVANEQKVLSSGEDLGEAEAEHDGVDIDDNLASPNVQENFIEVFTTRPDTIFGVTFITLAPEHELVDIITTQEHSVAVANYVAYTKNRTERERMTDVRKITGQFTGAYAIHPFTGIKIPIWIGEYVLAGYGTGAVMGVPGHDSRDYAFARHFNLEIREVVKGGDLTREAYETKSGTLVNSDFLNGLDVPRAISKAIEKIEDHKLGVRRINYRLRDAVFGRQRYWGEPIPVYYKNGIPYPLLESELPLVLPDVDKFLPTEAGDPPLGRAINWLYKGKYPYELTTMPGWAGSSWYYLRYMDATNTRAFAGPDALGYWKNVDLYLGGSEHATGHLLYVRFWTKVLYDLGHLAIDEPAQKLINQGMIQGISCFVYRINGTQKFVSYGLKDKYITTPLHVDVSLVNNNILDTTAFCKWREEFASAEFVLEEGKYICGTEVEKMSKSKWNVVNPDDIIAQYGADCFRMYEMFLGPIEQSKPWNTNGITGVANFLRKFWKLWFREGVFEVSDEQPTPAEYRILHRTMKKTAEDVERFSFNTSVSSFMICVNELTELGCNKRAILEPLAITISPFAPHIAEELWHLMGNQGSIVNAKFPEVLEEHLTESEFEYPVSINGKTRFKLTLSLTLSKEQVEERVLGAGDMNKYLDGKSPKKIIVVPGRIVNVVI
jgi:leucyl-tRNA synthetase